MENETDDPRAAEKRHAEMKEKLYAEAEEIRIRNAGRANDAQQAGYPCRPALRERVDKRRRCAAETAAHEHNDVVRLTELSNLLESHPAVARILELIEATGV